MAENEYREKLSLDVSKFLGGLKQAQDSVKNFAQQGKGHIKDFSGQFDKMRDSILESAKAFTVLAAAPAALVAMTKAAGGAAEELDQIRIQTGLATSESQSWSVALRRVGLDAGDLAFMFRILSQNVIEARNRSSEAARMFDVLGVSQKTLATGNTGLIMREMVQQFSKIENGADKSALAIQLLGRSALQFLPAMEQDLDEAAKASERFGKLNEDQIAQLARMDDSFDDLETAIKKGSNVFAAQFAPSIDAVVKSLTDLVVILKDLSTGTIGTVFTKIVQGWSAIFVGFVGLLKEVGVNLGAIGQSIKALFTESSLNLGSKLQQIWGGVREEIDAIEAETEGRLRGIFSPDGASSEDGRRKVTLPDDPKKAHDAASKAIDNEYKRQQAIIEAQKQAALNQAAFEKVQIQESVANRAIGAQRVVELEAKTNQDIIRAKITANNLLVQADTDAYRQRMTLAKQAGGGGIEEEKQITAEFQILQINRNAEAKALRQEAQRQGLTDTVKMLQTVDTLEAASGQRKTQAAQSEYAIRRDIRNRELSDTVALKDAEVAAGEADLLSYEQMAQRRLAALQARYAQELAAAENNQGQQEAIRTKYNAQIDREQRRLQNGFVEGWREAFNSYVNDMTGPLGLGVDMMRQTAQQMQQAFRTVFFNAMNDQIHSLQDVLREFGNFAKNIISQVLSQLATLAVMRGLGQIFGGFGGLFGGGSGTVMAGSGASAFAAQGGLIKRFALGGPVFSNGDSVPAMLTPGEFVVSRRGVDTLNKINQGQGLSGETNVTVNVINSGREDKPQVNVRRQMKGMMIDILYKDPDLRQALRTT